MSIRSILIMFVLALVLSPVRTLAQGTRYDNIVLGPTGRPVGNATITVCTSAGAGTPCTPLATIYSNEALTTVTANPFAADGLGNYGFWANAATYKISITGSGLTNSLSTVTLPTVVSNVVLTNPTGAQTINGGFALTNTGAINAPVIEAVRYADQFAGADCGAKINAADAALGATAGEIWVNQACGTNWQTSVILTANHFLRIIQPGNYTINSISTSIPGGVIGLGRGLVTIVGSATSPATLITVTTASQTIGLYLVGFSIDLTAAPLATAISLNNGLKSVIRDIQFTKGTLGLKITNTNDGIFQDLFFNGQTTGLIDYNGDGGMENYFDRIIGSVGSGVTMTTGFNFSRTTSPNIGGLYISNYKLTLDGGSLTNNMKFRSTSVSPTQTDIRLYNVVPDSANLGDSTLFENISGVVAVNCTFGVADATGNTFAAVKIGNVLGQSINNYTFVGSNFSGTGLGINVLGTNVTLLKLIGNRFLSSGAFHIKGAANLGGTVSLHGNFFNNTLATPVTDSPSSLIAALLNGQDPYSEIDSIVAGEPVAKIVKGNSGTANQNGGTFFFDNIGPTGVARNSGVVGGNLQWRFSQPTSGTLQLGAAIEVRADGTQSGLQVPSKLVFRTAPAADSATAIDRGSFAGDGGYHLIEQAAPAGVLAEDVIWADLTAHKFKANNNNGGAVTLAYVDLAQTWSGNQTNMALVTPTMTSPTINTGVSQGSGFKHQRVASCTTAAPQFSLCTTSVTWTAPFADANYTVWANCDNPVGVPLIEGTQTKAAGSIVVVVTNITAVAASCTINIAAAHD